MQKLVAFPWEGGGKEKIGKIEKRKSQKRGIRTTVGLM